MVRVKGRGAPNLGKRIEQRMEERGIDSTILSSRSGISISYVNRIIHGDVANPTIDFVIRLAAALGVAVSDLVGPSPPRRRRGALPSPPLEQPSVGQQLDSILDEEGLSLEERSALAETLILPHTRHAARLMKLTRGGRTHEAT